MKKIIASALALLLAVSLAACGGQQNNAANTGAPATGGQAESPAPGGQAESQETGAQAAPQATDAPVSAAQETPAAEETAAQAAELIVAAAASLTDVTQKLAETYRSKAPNVTLTFTYGSSGALQQQIEEGAPVDIFMSAARRQMNELAEKGLLDGESINLLTNKIALIVPSGSMAGIESFEDAGTDKVQTIAFGDPATTPAGQYAQEIFTGLGIVDAVNAKANLGSDVRQVLTWVEIGEVDCGIVFMTDALTTEDVEIVAVAEDGSHTPAIYPVGIIEESQNKEAARAFVDFLSSNEAAAIFETYGFSMY